MVNTISNEDLTSAMRVIYSQLRPFGLLAFAGAEFQAGVKFAGRDRRRIKREMRKAGERARAEERKNPTGINRSAVPFWRTRGGELV